MTDPRIPDLSTVSSPPRRAFEYEDIKNGSTIGRGGNAVVKRTELSTGGSPQYIAVKEPQRPGDPAQTQRKTLDAEVVEAFFEEAETWMQLDTAEREKQLWEEWEYIVGIVDTGEQFPWIAMEYMDGGGLDERLYKQPDGLPIAEALWIGECLCRGVKLAHDHGIAHLDLKGGVQIRLKSEAVRFLSDSCPKTTASTAVWTRSS